MYHHTRMKHSNISFATLSARKWEESLRSLFLQAKKIQHSLLFTTSGSFRVSRLASGGFASLLEEAWEQILTWRSSYMSFWKKIRSFHSLKRFCVCSIVTVNAIEGWKPGWNSFLMISDLKNWWPLLKKRKKRWRIRPIRSIPGF